MKTPLSSSVAAASAGLLILASSLQANVVFSESFEAPVVSGYDDNTVPSGGRWIGSSGEYGSSNRGLYNESFAWPATAPFTTPFGSQAYYLNYGGTGLTTAVGATGQTLTAGLTYRVTFNTAVAAGTTSGNYLVELVAFGPADTNTVRASLKSPRPGTVLANATGTVTTTNMSTAPGIVFTPAAGNAHLGKDVGIRIVKSTNSVLYDNIRLVVGHDMAPSPASGVTVPSGNVPLGWTNMPPNTGSDIYVDVWFGTNPDALTKVVSGALNLGTTTVSAPVAGTYYWRVDSYLDGQPTGTPATGSVFHFIVDDTDGDGFPDAYEQLHTTPSSPTALNPNDNLDNDGLTNAQEYFYGTNPRNADTDGDSLLDGPELTGVGQRPATSPILADTDRDGVSDSAETNTGTWAGASNTGTNPAKADTDGDGLKDGVETNTGTLVDRFNTGTNPFLADTDTDGVGDYYEATAAFTNPIDSSDKPEVPYPLPDPDNSTGATDKPVKVYILSGQSNMVGIGFIKGGAGSLDTTTKIDNRFPNLVDASNKYTVRKDVIYRGVITATASGPLTAGMGSDNTQLGPELGFGHVMGWYHDEPVLIIKASEGNRGIGWSILPPGSTRFTSGANTYAAYGESPQNWPTSGGSPSPSGWYAGKDFNDFFQAEADFGAPSWANGVAYPANTFVMRGGVPYISKSAHTSTSATEPGVGASWTSSWNLRNVTNVTDILDNFSTLYPQFAAQGFEIAGYGWFQGHWDSQSSVYANRYEVNMARLIRQVRSYYATRYPGKATTQTPFAIAAIGFSGDAISGNYRTVMNAQLAMNDTVKYPDFAGNVRATDSRGYWRTTAESPGNQGFHYNNNAETYLLVGDAIARNMIDLQANGAGNSRLSALTVSTGALSPAFSGGTTNYTMTVPNLTNSLSVTATVSALGATITINGTPATSSTPFGPIALNTGQNTIPIVVTSQDTTSITTYTLTVTRTAPDPANPALSDLVPSAGTLSPAFASNTTGYTATVAFSNTSITVTPTAVEAGATITVNGIPVTSGNPSAAIPLVVGTNGIQTVVTSPDGNVTRTYTLTITRQPLSANADLANLSTEEGTLTPAFASGTLSYNATVPFETESIFVVPTAAHPAASITVNGGPVESGIASAPVDLEVGDNTLTTVVTAEDGITTRTYTLVVTRLASSRLSALALSSGTLTPVFSSETLGYVATVSTATSFITVTPTAIDAGATITVNGNPVASGSASSAIPLSLGANLITIAVTAADENTNTTYTVNVTRTQLTYTWALNVAGPSPWNDSASWSPNTGFPDARDDLAALTNNITVDNQISLSAPVTIGGLRIGDASGNNKFTINAGNSINLDVENGSTTITRSATGTGADAIAAPIILADPLIVAVNSSSGSLTLSGGVSETAGGAKTITKTGSGALSLRGSNSFSGNIIITGGKLNDLSANSAGTGGNIIFDGSGTVSPAYVTSGNPAAIDKTVVVNSGVTASFTVASQYYKMILSGPLTGGGVLDFTAGSGGGAGYVTFSSNANTFTGTVRSTTLANASAPLTVNSLPDSANPIQLQGSNNSDRVGVFALGSGTATPLLFNQRQIDLYGIYGGRVENNNATAGNTITINTDLKVSASGNKTFGLGGSNTGNNTFAGKIADGTGAVIGLTKSGTGNWTVSNPANTFTGTITLNSTSTSAGRLSYASAAGTNPISFLQTSGTATLAYTGASPLMMSGLINASAMTSGTVTLEASGTTPAAAVNYSNANSFTSVATSNTIRKLVLTGTNTGNNIFAGAFTNNVGTTNAATLTKNGDGTWILTGANAYTGATSVTAGKLFINGDQTAANGNVSVSANATLGGSGIIGGNTTIAANGRLEFTLGATAASHDKLELAAGRTFILSGASTLTLASTGVSAPGDYTLVTALGGFGSSVPPATVILPSGWTADAPRFVGNDLKINITSTGIVQSPFVTWAGPGNAFDGDANNDGISNGMAWFLGAANPSADARALLPTASEDNGGLVFQFRCLNAASRGNAAAFLQHSGDLADNGWIPTALPEVSGTVNGVHFEVTPDGDFNQITATIPANQAVAGKLFARLRLLLVEL